MIRRAVVDGCRLFRYKPICLVARLFRLGGRWLEIPLRDYRAPGFIESLVSHAIEHVKVVVVAIDEVIAHVAAARLVCLPVPAVAMPGDFVRARRMEHELCDRVAPQPPSRVTGHVMDDLEIPQVAHRVIGDVIDLVRIHDFDASPRKGDLFADNDVARRRCRFDDRVRWLWFDREGRRAVLHRRIDALNIDDRILGSQLLVLQTCLTASTPAPSPRAARPGRLVRGLNRGGWLRNEFGELAALDLHPVNDKLDDLIAHRDARLALLADIDRAREHRVGHIIAGRHLDDDDLLLLGLLDVDGAVDLGRDVSGQVFGDRAGLFRRVFDAHHRIL